MMTAFTKMTGAKYLQVLAPTLNMLVENVDGYEIDPTKIRDGEDIPANAKRLDAICQYVLDAIIGTINSCPIPFRVQS
jgi:hypothetical protein